MTQTAKQIKEEESEKASRIAIEETMAYNASQAKRKKKEVQ